MEQFFHLSAQDQAALFAVFATHAAKAAPLMFTCGPFADEGWGQVAGEDVYHCSLSRDAYGALLAEHGFALLDFVVEDPDCGRHTICLAQKL